MKQRPHTLFRSTALIAASLAVGLMSSCGSQTDSKDTTTRTAVEADSVKKPAPVANLYLTLPVLDALFYDESFEKELSSKLALSSEQVTRLKTISRTSVEELTEDGIGDYSGSARSAVKRSDEQIRGILGDGKTEELYQLVSQRYASGDVEGLLPATPNAIPTDTRIVVNAPAYRMDVFRDGKLLKTYKVGIGYPEFPLPTGMRRAETIIFNPTWTPPDEPWVKGKFKPGEAVEAGSKDNPLGPIKIPIGSPSLIHGGKAVSKLGKFASHGCVGLTNAQVREFAGFLGELSGTGIDSGKVADYGKTKTETKHVKLEKPVPVELRYETIVAEDGALRVFRDVYERGTNTLDNARRVLEAHGVSYDSMNPAEKTALMAALTEMNRDPKGDPIVENIGAAPDGSAGPDSGKRADPSKSAAAKSGKETKTVIGRKEVAVPMAQLRGKGYPAPMALNEGK